MRACVRECVCVLELMRKTLNEVMKCVYLISRVDYVLLVVYIFCCSNCFCIVRFGLTLGVSAL